MIDLYQPGAYCRTAGGNLERPAIQSPVVRWMAWSINSDNGGGGSASVWDRCRSLWGGAGIQDFPWLHCRSLADIQRLLDVASLEGSPAIGLNIEDVKRDFTDKGVSLQDIAQKIAGWSGEVHMATLPWVQNAQGWSALSCAVAALELFPDEQAIWPGGVYSEKIANDCIEHARDEGLPKITLMFKTKGYAGLSAYSPSSSVCHSLYTADDITPDAPAWLRWRSEGTCDHLIVPTAPLTEKQYPYTGPYYGPSNDKGPMKGPTAKALKRAQVRLGNFDGDLGSLDEHYNRKLEDAMRAWQRTVGIEPTGQYGRGSWMAMRYARVPSGPHRGEYAMDAAALALVKQDANTICYPLRGTSTICQGLHQTAGLTGNWAMDFCAAGGTAVVAVERATIRKLSGRDPALGAENTIGIFGWSIHYETANGYRYYATHFGTRAVRVGQVVECGQIIGTVGSWPGNPGRSHLHLGVTSPINQADAKKRITLASQADEV